MGTTLNISWPDVNYLYYILMEGFKDLIDNFQAGNICYMEEAEYLKTVSESPDKKLRVYFPDTYTPRNADVSCLQPLKTEEAGLLLAITDDSERLHWYLEKQQLEKALALNTDQEIIVDVNSQLCRGVLRYIGPITSKRLFYGVYIFPTYFGVELQGDDAKNGVCDGTYQGKRFFQCDHNSGIFVPFSKLRFLSAQKMPTAVIKEPSVDNMEQLKIGDKVQFFTEDNTTKFGVVVELMEKEAVIVTDGEESSSDLKIPLECVMKEEMLSKDLEHDGKMDRREPLLVQAKRKNSDETFGLTLNSMVEVYLTAGKTAYGIVRWLGKLPGKSETFAGLELEDDVGICDGSFKGQRCFFCAPRRGLFVRLQVCRPDSRFQRKSPRCDMNSSYQSDYQYNDRVPPLVNGKASQVLLGKMKGIQGHCNSCYMDSVLFSLFSCSLVLDSMLYKSSNKKDSPIQTTLREEIVNPLRAKGFVPSDSVMKLRTQLMERGHSASFTTDEKDPEEFLTLIMHHILEVEPLLHLQQPGQKEQGAYCYQIFIEQDNGLIIPSVQQLLEHSFHSSVLKLSEVPSCLIIQMPRFGKKFKLFDKIIPSLELDITDLLSNNPRSCVICGDLADQECSDCFKDHIFSNAGFKQFCRNCSQQVHCHPRRKDHHPTKIQLPQGLQNGCDAQRYRVHREVLELFAVLCIETSHYVSFVKYGPQNQQWMFFDSMADRHGDKDGYNIPTVIQCPEVAKYLDMPLNELARQNPRDMEGVAKRLFCDAYMFLYQSKRMALYK
ncbi:ubiquitin carboxyl-terminal hydrolase CYLD [Polypterus senegalus]|uniref:ubiquitin carboxyl-terminal hydrolase CYLD n=1 Tax=Polypterus senegalus TaxID=55291 RepID=UPI0019659398|nr:ubiquitin carboxyl-terminal hydrolase CYLD [Polypterus senegalus]XP_039609687.1 ubiquitin carboxyl-terminal hydrolase CYLD [Polypterus senegalus]